jgi:hypothetical protein
MTWIRRVGPTLLIRHNRLGGRISCLHMLYERWDSPRRLQYGA